VSVLALSHTAIFRVYYFQMYAALVLLGAAHGLVLLPVLLAAFGPEELEVGGWVCVRHVSGSMEQRELVETSWYGWLPCCAKLCVGL
jgi:Niemann-Pick C1 protein